MCITHALAPISTSLLLFDTEWVMRTCKHQGRDSLQQNRRYPLALVSLDEMERAERGSGNFLLNQRSN